MYRSSRVELRHGDIDDDVWFFESDDESFEPKLILKFGDTAVVISPENPHVLEPLILESGAAGPMWDMRQVHVEFAEALADAADKYRKQIQRIYGRKEVA